MRRIPKDASGSGIETETEKRLMPEIWDVSLFYSFAEEIVEQCGNLPIWAIATAVLLASLWGIPLLQGQQQGILRTWS